ESRLGKPGWRQPTASQATGLSPATKTRNRPDRAEAPQNRSALRIPDRQGRDTGVTDGLVPPYAVPAGHHAALPHTQERQHRRPRRMLQFPLAPREWGGQPAHLSAQLRNSRVFPAARSAGSAKEIETRNEPVGTAHLAHRAGDVAQAKRVRLQ